MSEVFTPATLDVASARGMSRREVWILGAILLLAFCLRLVYVLQMSASPYFDEPQVDQRFYVEWGREIAHGHTSPEGVYLRAPLYAWWLGAQFALFGENLLAARILQALAGTAAIALLYLVARRVFDARTARIAALLGATFWVLIYFDGELLRESLVNAANLLGLWLTLRWLESPKPGRGAAAGLAWGLAALLRPQVLLIVAVLATVAMLRKLVNLRAAIVFALSVAAPIAPITLHNALAGDLVIISPESGLVLWIANNPDADGLTAFAPGMRHGWMECNTDSKLLAEQATGHALKPSEVSSFYVHKTWNWVSSDPAGALRLLASKARLLVADFEYGGSPEEPRFFAERFAPIVRWLPLSFGFLAAFAVLGLWTSRQRGNSAFVLSGFLAIYALTLVAFLVNSRYRAPMLPVLIAYSAAGLMWMWDSARDRAWIRVASGVALCSAVYALAHSAPFPEAASRANGLWWLGLDATRKGRNEEALALLDEAIALRPDFSHLYAARGLAERALGNRAQAVNDLEEALRLKPDDVDTIDVLTEVEIRDQHVEHALALAERSIHLAPHLPRAYYHRGRCLFYGRKLAEAADSFRAALQRNPKYFNAAYSLGVVARELGADEEAVHALRIAAENSAGAKPEFAIDVHEQLVDLLLAQGHTAEAKQHAQRIAKRFPSDARVQAVLRRF